MESLRFLAAEIRFINYMIYEMCGPKLEDIPGFPKLEGIADLPTLKRAQDRIGGNFQETYQKAKVGPVLGCLKAKTYFLFREQNIR